jgi:hypothetical protein
MWARCHPWSCKGNKRIYVVHERMTSSEDDCQVEKCMFKISISRDHMIARCQHGLAKETSISIFVLGEL